MFCGNPESMIFLFPRWDMLVLRRVRNDQWWPYTSISPPKNKITYLEPQTTIYKWLFRLDDSQSLHRGWLFHQTSIYKWLFGVPGISMMPHPHNKPLPFSTPSHHCTTHAFIVAIMLQHKAPLAADLIITKLKLGHGNRLQKARSQQINTPGKNNSWNPKMEVWFKWCSFSIGWFLGSIR